MTDAEGGRRVAVVQHPPVLLDRSATLSRAAQFVGDAAQNGSALVTFPEAFVPGYPMWIWRLRPGADYDLTSQIHARLLDEAVDLRRQHLQPLQDAARTHRVTVVVGIHERDGEHSRATLYNSLVVIAEDGSIVNVHRKLVPTNPERMVWGPGDAEGLRAVDTSVGRVGGLMCWENLMPLARFALYADGVQIHCAPTWDTGEGWLATMRHIAQEGRCWVLGNGCAMQGRDVPEDFPERASLFPDEDEWLNDGDSVIVAPGGSVVVGPMHREHGVLYAECDASLAASQKRTFDVTGHYHRPDVFRLRVTRMRAAPVEFADPSQGS